MIHIWKDIKGWEEYYEVSDRGEVRNKQSGNLIVGDRNNCGYLRVTLYNKDNNPPKQRFFRHRLVAEHFIPNEFGLREVNHKDLNLDNNTVENLEWVSRTDNEIHSHEFGSKPFKPYRVLFSNGENRIFKSAGTLAEELGITRAAVRFWLKGMNKGFLNYGIDNIEYV